MGNTKNNQGTVEANEALPELVYPKEQIELLLNLINQTLFQGIQQIQLIAQISAVLSNPIKVLPKENEETE